LSPEDGRRRYLARLSGAPLRTHRQNTLAKLGVTLHLLVWIGLAVSILAAIDATAVKWVLLICLMPFTPDIGFLFERYRRYQEDWEEANTTETAI